MDTYRAPDRFEEHIQGNEREQLDAWLDFYRSTLLVKCDGLNLVHLSERPVPTSRLSLLGLVQHMALVELYWFAVVFKGEKIDSFFGANNDPEVDFNDLASHSPEEIFDLFDTATASARVIGRSSDLETVGKTLRHGREVDLRWIYLHMIEEYARHCGHADILREIIDGTTGY
ncbi:MAG TPA: DinB family protein [Acidimicrobiales bacterium]